MATQQPTSQPASEYQDTFGVFVSQHIGDVKVGQHGLAPIRAMLDVIGQHAADALSWDIPRQDVEYHADILGQSYTVVIVREDQRKVDDDD